MQLVKMSEIQTREVKPANRHDRANLDKLIIEYRIPYLEFYKIATRFLGREITVRSMMSGQDVRELVSYIKREERGRLERLC